MHLYECFILSNQVFGDVENVKEVIARNLEEEQGHIHGCNNDEEIVVKSKRKQAPVCTAARPTRLKQVITEVNYSQGLLGQLRLLV